MRHLTIQLQPERVPALDAVRVTELIESLSRDHTLVAGFETTKGDDEGDYINFTYLAKNPAMLWKKIQTEVLADPKLGARIAKAAIVVCEGPNGWDDYLLLHHFDRTLVLDSADEL